LRISTPENSEAGRASVRTDNTNRTASSRLTCYTERSL
jgi:hypothetical protein